MPHAYMLECSDGSFYVGSTKGLPQRLWEHDEGLAANYTRDRRPVKLVWCEEYDRVDLAYAREKQVQNWSRAKRIALIEGRYSDLPNLAERYAKKRRREREEQADNSDPSTEPPEAT